MNNQYLQHHGVKGMKWGVRRYQNKDGSLTPAGKKHVGNLNGDERTNAINKKVQDDIRIRSNVASNASNMTGHAGRVNSSIRSIRQKKASNQIDLSNMTDKELQTRINRMNLERQYRSLKTESIGSGQRYVDDVLNIGGAALAGTASALSIALLIKQLRG